MKHSESLRKMLGNQRGTRSRLPMMRRRPLAGRRLSCIALFAAAAIVGQGIIAGLSFGADRPELRLVVKDAGSGEVLPARVHLRDASGTPVLPPGFPAWHDHFTIPAEATLPLPAGEYAYEVERGPEYSAAQGRFSSSADRSETAVVTLNRLANLAAEGWYAGDTHVHRPLEDIELLMRAEDLYLAEVITWWNDTNLWSHRPQPPNPVVRFDGDRFYDALAGEDERGGGALLYFGLNEPLAIAGSEREYPSSIKFFQEARGIPGAWIEAEKPFWWDLPLWVALGGVDSVGLAHNHLQRGGVLDNEAWGKARDRDRFPPPAGNGLWTQQIYSHLLNCGLRIPPTAGSASGVLPNPLGYNRVYARVEGELSYAKWWEAVRQGRVFVTNGPLLRVTADGFFPGHVFRSERPISVFLQGPLDSREPIAAVELVRNGRVDRIALPSTVTLRESGWFFVRAVADVKHTYRFASTGPFYVEIGDTPRPVHRDSAQFFLDWTRERAAALKVSDPAKREQVMAFVRQAEAFWEARVAESLCMTDVPARVADLDTGRALPFRGYFPGDGGYWFFPESAASGGTAFRYESTNWINPDRTRY